MIKGREECRGDARDAVRTLNPGYFALVMATGILSIAMYHQHAYALSVVLLWLPASSSSCWLR
jgi:tellurite resistance protein TehA-like permease